MVSMLIQNRTRADGTLAYQCARKFLSDQRSERWQLVRTGALAAVILVVLLSTTGAGQRLATLFSGAHPTVHQQVMKPTATASSQGPSSPAAAVKRQTVTAPAAGAVTRNPDVPAEQMLGVIEARDGDTIGDMIRRVYGPYSFTRANLRRVMAFNHHIRTPTGCRSTNGSIFPSCPSD